MIVVSGNSGAFLSILRKKRDGISRNPVKSRLPLTDNTFVSNVKNSKINGFSVLRISQIKQTHKTPYKSLVGVYPIKYTSEPHHALFAPFSCVKTLCASFLFARIFGSGFFFSRVVTGVPPPLPGLHISPWGLSR